MNHYQARRHPLAAGIALLILGPLLLAAALLVVVFYVLAETLHLAGGRR